MAGRPTDEETVYSYRHAAHRQVVHSASIADVRDAVATGRVAEPLNFTTDDLLQGLPPPDVPLWRDMMAKGMAGIRAAEPPRPKTEPPPHRPPPQSGKKRRHRAKPPPQPLLTAPDPRLVQLRDHHRGQAAVVIAGGPSLETPEARDGLRALTVHRAEHDAPVVIGVNRARIAFPGCDYLAVMDRRLYTEDIADHSGWSHLFRGWEARMFVQDLVQWPQGPFIRVRPLPEHVGFSFDLRKGFHRGFTTVMLALQAAVWMGCPRLYLAGVDLRHGPRGKTHFFGHMPWNAERDGEAKGRGLFASMLMTFEAVAPLLAGHGIRVYNLNPESAVRCFPFTTWDQAIYGLRGVMEPPERPSASTAENNPNGLTVGMED
jgi:hypothetical protein